MKPQLKPRPWGRSIYWDASPLRLLTCPLCHKLTMTEDVFFFFWNATHKYADDFVMFNLWHWAYHIKNISDSYLLGKKLCHIAGIHVCHRLGPACSNKKWVKPGYWSAFDWHTFGPYDCRFMNVNGHDFWTIPNSNPLLLIHIPLYPNDILNMVGLVQVVWFVASTSRTNPEIYNID